MKKKAGAKSPVNIEEANRTGSVLKENESSKENKIISNNIRNSFSSDASEIKII